MSTRHVRLRSLAKINLDLRVLHKRPDGYHELRTIFQTVSLADTIEIDFIPRQTTQVRLDSDLDIPSNLILRAAHAYLEAAQATGHIRFRLEKKIPMGGGLGGGSSNAATVLLALPVLAGKPLSPAHLQEIAGELGSDVPFFLHGGTALGLGRGDELYPLPEIASRPAILVAPGIHVSTPEAFRALNRELTQVTPSRNTSEFQSVAWKLGEQRTSLDWNVANDFETAVFREHPQLQSIKRQLKKLGASPALMSGSGSTIFGIFQEAFSREAAIAALRGKYDTVLPVSLINRSRYRTMWWRQLQDHIGTRAWPPQSRYSK
jgi:4-diphosphocytidyl-2-C-methyl-D-erythritol kinase